jgi:TetR/AcrR family fatty acid metabolism transcriptional regulator
MMADSFQEQMAAARRNQILDAAATIFAKKGFHPTTIKDIATEAGVADGTIYNYFKSKTALLIGVFERMREAVLADGLPEPSPEMDFQTLLTELLAQPMRQMKEENFALFRVIVSEAMVNDELRTLYYEQILQPTLDIAEHVFKEWSDKGVIQVENPALLARIAAGMMLGVMMTGATGDEAVIAQWDNLPPVMTDVLLNGIKQSGEPS